MSAPTAVVTADVEILLDLGAMSAPPTSQEDLAALWTAVEATVVGRDLSTRRLHELECDRGVVRFEIVRANASVRAVGPHTRFSIVGVREPAKINYRCVRCAEQGLRTYGPFECVACASGDTDGWVCDRHVRILDGALFATCEQHRPACRDCGRQATFRCAGPRCDLDVAWCDSHRRPHPQDTDVDYCSPCYEYLFPRCADSGCGAVGSVRCEHVDTQNRVCGTPMCTRHAQRWQVFGGERLGLARCTTHQDLVRLSADEVIRQIVAGAAVRKPPERAPTLPGFAHSLRRCGHAELALRYRDVFSKLTALGGDRGGDNRIARAVAAATPGWQRQLKQTATASEDGMRLVERLRELIRADDPRYGHTLAEAISLAEYKAARTVGDTERKAMLFIHLPEELRGQLIGQGGSRIRGYGETLGVVVKFEGSRRAR
jgi:hypothetical protein